jgi:hypothetical protein
MTRRTPLELALEAERVRLVARLAEVHLAMARARKERVAANLPPRLTISVLPAVAEAIAAEAQRRGVSGRVVAEQIITAALDAAGAE